MRRAHPGARRSAQDNAAPGSVGISHTRWATHGRPTDENAHPHFDQSGRLALVHNGVIENYQALRAPLIEAGHTFRSQTDTEILAHLIGKIYDEAGGPHGKARLLEAVRAALKQVIGTYGIAVMHLDVPDVLIGARRGSPLSVGLGKGENFLVSDPQAIIAYTQEAIYLKDYDVARHRARLLRDQHAGRRHRGQLRGDEGGFHQRRREAGRVPALHAQGNLRAAARGARRPARAALASTTPARGWAG